MRRIIKVGIPSMFLTLGVAVASVKETPPKDRIPEAQAEKIAREAYAGSIKDHELEFEDGKWIYSFDMKKVGEKNVHEVNIDALTGKVLNVHVETAADEKKEAAEDHQEKEDD